MTSWAAALPAIRRIITGSCPILRRCFTITRNSCASGAGLYAATGDSFYRDITLGTAAYLIRDLRHPNGAFYSAEDTRTAKGREGTFYLWTLADFRRVLGEDADFAAALFGVTANGNFMDPHTREAGQNVLSRFLSPVVAAEKSGLAPETAAARHEKVRQLLFEERARRPRPHRDEKILTEWNGLAVSALARAGFLLGDQALLNAAAKAADFLATSLLEASSGALYRRWYDGRPGDSWAARRPRHVRRGLAGPLRSHTARRNVCPSRFSFTAARMSSSEIPKAAITPAWPRPISWYQ